MKGFVGTCTYAIWDSELIDARKSDRLPDKRTNRSIVRKKDNQMNR